VWAQWRGSLGVDDSRRVYFQASDADSLYASCRTHQIGVVLSIECGAPTAGKSRWK
jgi:hypothetical protein